MRLPALAQPLTRLGRGLVPAALVLLLDQLTKWVMVSLVMVPPRIIEVTPFFNLVMAWNTGVSFSLFTGAGPWLLTGLSLGIAGGLMLWLARADGKRLRLALSLIIGGAIGNAIDRIRFGAVADFLDVHAMGYHWPAFNVADSAITIGAVLLVWDSLFPARKG
ncbi:signal peptidase II [Roseospirillum parvum]|uniref:Lipoprotein signal peptidase n=1 Tax=Roseospirillum parvum TaxID=83401 RepID=A0A1G8EKY2_9PROT|nr:signal peptidase II [Roseospirillum parvum]SDH70359.1 signal peptidase II [Roseospirillum parvum]